MARPAQGGVAEERQAPIQKPVPVLTRAPELVQFHDAQYPAGLLTQGFAGEVLLDLDIDAQGFVFQVALKSASHPEFGAAAMVAATHFRFTPAEIDGVPAPIRIEYRYRFSPDLGEPDAITGLAFLTPPAPPANLIGLVREAGTRVPIAGAAILIDGAARATTGKDGRFALRVPAGPIAVLVKSAEHEPYAGAAEVGVGEAVEMRVYLVRASLSPFETVVRTRADRSEVSKVELDRREVSRVPGTFGDPVRVIENLPGIARTPGGLGGALLVHGARPSATAVTLDGVLIPQIFHFGGLTSVVNAEFLENITLYPGGFPVRFGDATAGAVEVTSRDPACDQWRGSGRVDIMHSSAFMCVPSGSWRVAAAARRSYIDFFLPYILDQIPRREDEGVVTAAPVYWDYQAKALTTRGAHTLDLFAFGSDDRLQLIQSGSAEDINFDFGLTLTFHRLVARHRFRPDERLSVNSSLALGYQRDTFTQVAPEIDLENSFAVDIWSLDWREELTLVATPWLTVRAGLDHRFGTAGLALEGPIPTELRVFPTPTFDFTAALAFARDIDQYNQGYWLDAVIKPHPSLKLIPGLRVDRWDFHQTQDLSVQPRLIVRWQAWEPLTLKGAYGIFEKLPPPEFLIDSLGNPALDPERAHHLILGFEYQVTPLITVDLQGFYNWRSNLPSPSQSYTYQDGKRIPEVWDSAGLGRAYGLELLLRHEAAPDSRFYGWLSYTLSRALQRDRRPDTTYVIQNPDGLDEYAYSERASQEYLTPYDQTHILTVIGALRLPWAFELGARFRLVSGNPYTPLEKGRVYLDVDEDRYRVDLSDVGRNSERLPAFDQLDVRLDRTFTFDLWRLTAYVEVLNVYNAENAEQYRYDYRFRHRVPIRLLPILPIVGVEGTF